MISTAILKGYYASSVTQFLKMGIIDSTWDEKQDYYLKWPNVHRMIGTVNKYCGGSAYLAYSSRNTANNYTIVI